jgi:hypothetical protein
LNQIKAIFCVGKKIKGGIVVLGLLKLKQIDVQASCFKFIMNHNVEAMMWEPSNVVEDPIFSTSCFQAK